MGSIKLMEVRGIADACLSLKMSMRRYTKEYESRLRDALRAFSNDLSGYVYDRNRDRGWPIPVELEYDWFRDELNKLAKWGAGFGHDCHIDAGHETLLRFIDLSIMVTDLHRGGMDDFDSHAMRMNNRIVRSSSRLANYDASEISDWYKDKIIPFAQMWERIGLDTITEFFDEKIIVDENTFVLTDVGYIREDCVNDNDVRRGLYPLSIPMNCVCKISLHDMRHIYKRRNAYTHAAPELKALIEDLADQIEEALPGDLGKLVRYDYCDDGQLHHIMDIVKTCRPRDGASN